MGLAFSGKKAIKRLHIRRQKEYCRIRRRHRYSEGTRQQLAKKDGVSLNQWIAVAVAQKVGVSETAAEFFARRADAADGKGLVGFLENAPDVDPESNDRI